MDPNLVEIIGLFIDNCADAVEWFLDKFAHVSKSTLLDNRRLTLNYLGWGIFVPSCLPIGVTLPGRVMDNAKMHHAKSKGA